MNIRVTVSHTLKSSQMSTSSTPQFKGICGNHHRFPHHELYKKAIDQGFHPRLSNSGIYILHRNATDDTVGISH